MKFGLFLPQPGSPPMLDVVVAFVRAAEARGFNSAWAGEHAVLFDEYSSYYPYGAEGKWELGAEQPWLEPFLYLTFLAAQTERIRIGTGVVLLPQRNPVYTAKSVGTLDFLSGGRMDVGLGVGWSREEYEALGVPWEGRAARAREYLEVMRSLWRDEVAQHSGPMYDLPACRQRPTPVQKPNPPIYFGGETDAALRRVAELGDGWFGWAGPDQIGSRIAFLHRHLEEQGRDPSSVKVAIGFGWPGDAHRDTVERYAAAGVDQLLLSWPDVESEDQANEKIEVVARLFSDHLAANGG
jgi:probable F420-dependent oxidoreductase